MEDDLKRLKDLNPPPAREDVKARTLALAMDAFDVETKKSIATQGSKPEPRQSSIINLIWSSIMNKQLYAGSALATLMILPVAGFLTFQYVQNHPELTHPIAQDFAIKAAPEKPEPAVAREKAKTVEPVDALKEEKQLSDAAAQPTADRKDVAPLVEPPAATALASPSAPKMEMRAAKQSMAMSGNVAPAAAMDERRQLEGEAAADMGLAPQMETDKNRFSDPSDNPVKSVASDPVSTFSVDVDTASYSFVRRDLMSGFLPEPEEVRVEEMINYFPYSYPGPDNKDTPFKASVTVTPTPWNANTRLMHIGIKGYDIAQAERPKANLVFLIDVSGSMDEENKLPLLKSAFRLLVDTLKPDDTVSIVTYAGNAGVVLEPTKASDRTVLLNAIDRLQPGGSTAGAAGLQTAYQLAEKSFIKDGVNRVMLATDGDFNVGQTSDDELKGLIEAKRKSGVFLSVLGFGHDNYNDQMMQVLAQNGNGTAAFIDTLAEAQKALVEEAGASLFPIAKDVKLQVEFNPQKIAEYRLIGYETRALNREDFNNDKVDAGDIGSGHRVTAIYEVTPVGSPAVLNDAPRYAENKPATSAAPATSATSDELAFVKIRYKQPNASESKLITTPVTEANAVGDLNSATDDVRFSIAVAGFGQKLRHASALDDFGFDAMLTLASGAKGADTFGYRAEFLKLVQLAKSLSAHP